MQVPVAADHAGFELKQHVLEWLKANGYAALDLGTDSTKPVDYPDFAEMLARAILDGRAERGVLICGSGVGASVAANKFPGIRSGLCHDTYSAHQGVEHDNMNILALGARVIGQQLALELVRAFLAAQFSGAERHVRRLRKIKAIETSVCDSVARSAQ